MSTIISVGTTTATGFKVVPDTSGQLVVQTNGTTTALTIDTSQKATFAGAMAVAGATTVTSTLTANSFIPTSSTIPTNGMYLPTTNTVAFACNSAEFMRLDPTYGRLLIGSTNNSPYSISSGTTGGAAISNANFEFANAAYNTLGINKLNSTSGSLIAFAYNGSGLSGYISYNGGGVAYNTGSDYRLKTNVLPVTNALDSVSKLNPVSYNWVADNTPSQGFIAHELETVIPEAVKGEKDGVDDQGKPKYQAVDYSVVIPTLTAAIKELNEIVKNQAEQISALQAKVGTA